VYYLKKAKLFERVDGGVVKCLVCNRYCKVWPGKRGICGNYINMDGELYHLGYGILSAIESRPIEIKPLFHYWPNSTALTFSGFGCNFYCPWCQNYLLSFTHPKGDEPKYKPQELVRAAKAYGDEGLCASFNEPITLFDFLLDVFSLSKKEGLYGTMVTNGYFSPRALRELVEAGVDGYSIDIKGCTGLTKGRALVNVDHEEVFRNARRLLDLGAHVEIVFLIVTGFNDSDECIEWVIRKHLDYLGEDVPLHINRYYPRHRWKEPPTPISKLLKAKDLALKEGINYVYVGNIGSTELESTNCPRCGKRLITRSGYRVLHYSLTEDNRCPRCGHKIPIRGKYIPHKKYLFI